MKKTFCIMMLCLACGVLPGGAQTARYACRNLQQLAPSWGGSTTSTAPVRGRYPWGATCWW